MEPLCGRRLARLGSLVPLAAIVALALVLEAGKRWC
jgi:hypothetical protein